MRDAALAINVPMRRLLATGRLSVINVAAERRTAEKQILIA
jgi:hypothetical protein